MKRALFIVGAGLLSAVATSQNFLDGENHELIVKGAHDQIREHENEGNSSINAGQNEQDEEKNFNDKVARDNEDGEKFYKAHGGKPSGHYDHSEPKKPEGKSEPAPENKPEAKPEGKPEAKPEGKPESTPAKKPEGKEGHKQEKKDEDIFSINFESDREKFHSENRESDFEANKAFQASHADKEFHSENEATHKDFNNHFEKSKELDESSRMITDRKYRGKHNKGFRDNNNNSGVLSFNNKAHIKEEAEGFEHKGEAKLLENINLEEETKEHELIFKKDGHDEKVNKQIWRKKKQNRKHINEASNCEKSGHSRLHKGKGAHKFEKNDCTLQKDADENGYKAGSSHYSFKKRRHVESDVKNDVKGAKDHSEYKDKTVEHQANFEKNDNIKKHQEDSKAKSESVKVESAVVVKKD